MAEPEDVMVLILRNIQNEIAGLRRDMHVDNERFDQRLGDMTNSIKNLRNAMTADTMMSKFMLGDYEERLAALEEQVAKLSKPQ